jgi:hypothetical protein
MEEAALMLVAIGEQQRGREMTCSNQEIRISNMTTLLSILGGYRAA